MPKRKKSGRKRKVGLARASRATKKRVARKGGKASARKKASRRASARKSARKKRR